VLSRHPRSDRFETGTVELRRGDVTHPETLASAVRGVDTIVQAVQFPGYPVEDAARGRTFMDVDAAGTAAMVEAAVDAGVRKLVYLSGIGADARSDRVWFRAKGVAEAAVASSGLAHVVVRPSWAYGPGDASLNRFVRIIRLLPGFFPQIGSGGQALSPIFIDDLAWLVAEVAATSDADGRILEAGGPQVLTLDQIIRTAMTVCGRAKPIIHVPLPVVRLVAGALEHLPGQVLSRSAVDFITQSAVADSDAVKRVFPSFAPRPLAPALAGYL